jgi:hypothetical protein
MVYKCLARSYSLKTEFVHRTSFPTRQAARRALFEYVETLWAGWAIG